MPTLSPELLALAVVGKKKEYWAEAEKIIDEAKTYADADKNLSNLRTAQRTHQETLNLQRPLWQYGLVGGFAGGAAVGVVTYPALTSGTFLGSVLGNAAKSGTVGYIMGSLFDNLNSKNKGKKILEKKDEDLEKKTDIKPKSAMTNADKLNYLILQATKKLDKMNIVVSAENSIEPSSLTLRR